MTPDTYTRQEILLEVGDGQQLYVRDWGNPSVKQPIIFLHGGPGGSCKDRHKQLFDPERQRVIFFDQRGCGNSLPYGTLVHNTTDDLVGDIEKIADRLQLESFVLTGGSWGSCLALAYALRHPDRVAAMVIRGVFTGTRAEIDWVDKGEFRALFPDVWQNYLQTVPAQNQEDPTAYHRARALGDDTAVAKASLYAYSNLEGALLSLDDRFVASDFETFDYLSARIEMHYLAQDCFMAAGYILDNASTLTMPIWLIQGRYDMVCPPRAAYALHEVLPRSELIWTTSGHRDEREAWTVQRAILLRLSGANR